MRHFPPIALALVAACSSTGLRDDASPDLRIVLSPATDAGVDVRLEFAGDLDGTTRLAVPESWGPTALDPAWIGELRVGRAADASPLEVTGTPTAGVEVSHAPGARLSVSYRLEGLPAGYAEVDDYRPISDEHGFALFLPLVLLLPDHLRASGQPLDLEVGYAGLEERGWVAFSSFGNGRGPHRGTFEIDQVTQSMVAAGLYESTTFELPSGPYSVVQIGSNGAFTPASLAQTVRPLIASARTYFEESSAPPYLLTYAPAGEPTENGFALGGTALTNAFAFYFDPGVDPTTDPGLFAAIAHVLCHEYVHNWHGVLYFLDEGGVEHSTRWFVEGFTDFVTRRVLLRSGVLSPEAFRDQLNERIAAYRDNPHRDLTNLDAAARWSEYEISDMLYQRGELIAHWLDARIRAETGGAESLDDLLLALAADARAGERRPTLSTLEHWLMPRIGPATFTDLVRLVDQGGPVPLAETLAEPPLWLIDDGDRASYEFVN